MPTVTNTDVASHWCDGLKQQIPGKCSCTVTTAQAAAVATGGVFSTTAQPLEIVETAVEDGTPNRVTRKHR